jgi:hypothetical protein
MRLKLYHVVTSASTAEIEVVKEVKPPKLLLSYFYFKNRPLKDFIELIGYRPEILLDSGAYSAWSKGKNISPIDYMNYITVNKQYITDYIALDVIGDSDLTLKYYEIMKLKGLSPIPVFHYGDDENYLKLYIAEGNKYVALGNTVPIKNKTKVAEWVNDLTSRFAVNFHLLGSSSKKITENTDLYSCDSSTWIMMAVNGKPKHIPGTSRQAKIERAKHNMIEELNRCE